uniref:Uncharacterized protein n=1 Tax=Calcidiscus leptoporus TaxID=127549 RepID=A0A7S0JD34_9EUKA|mmetsp:Transcript_50523/g.116612  ORF Transcript_50523/g.116612 Transcript_50523/m.116612 type:complete len:316 (+) Transcript_50523:56-1003(+)
MWARVNAASVQQENAVSVMQIDMLALGVQQTQLDNVSMQATLIIGFALGMWAGETLEPLVDDQGHLCIFKSWTHMLCGVCFFMSVAACISCCFIVVTLASYVKQASQRAALLKSTSAAVANTRRHIHRIYDYFFCAVVLFIVSAGLLIWLFVGLPDRIRYEGEVVGPVEDLLTLLDDGTHLISCLNTYSAADNAHRDWYSWAVAVLNTFVIFGMGVWGLVEFRMVRHTYDTHELLAWYHMYNAEHKSAPDPNRGGDGDGTGFVTEHAYLEHASDEDSTEGDAGDAADKVAKSLKRRNERGTRATRHWGLFDWGLS